MTLLKKYNSWHATLSPVKQLIVSIMLNFTFCFTAWLIAENIFFNEEHAWGYRIFRAAWMAFFTTIVFNWPTMKALFKLFKRNNNNQPVEQ